VAEGLKPSGARLGQTTKNQRGFSKPQISQSMTAWRGQRFLLLVGRIGSGGGNVDFITFVFVRGACDMGNPTGCSADFEVRDVILRVRTPFALLGFGVLRPSSFSISLETCFDFFQ